MKTLITGGSGLVGYHCAKVFLKSVEVVSTDKTAKQINGFGVQQLDVTNCSQCREVMQREMPDVVIHAAAHTDVDYCELHPDVARKVNVEGTRNIVDAAREVNAKIVYMSTDYIFDGKHGPYDENARPNPLGYYAKSKWEGEKLVRALPQSLIIRSTVIYGNHPTKENFATWLIHQLQQGKQVRIVDDQYSSPTYAPQLAAAISFLIENKKSGIWNVSDHTWCNRYDFSLMIAEVFGLKKELIVCIGSAALQQPAPRPMKGGLVIDKLVNAGFPLKDSKACLQKMKQELISLGKRLSESG